MSIAPAPPDGRRTHDAASDLTPCRLCELVQAAVAEAMPAAQDRMLKLAVDVPGRAAVLVDVTPFRQALTRLLQLAVRQSPWGGEIVITAVDIGGFVELEIADSGPGLIDGPKASLAEFSASRGRADFSLAWIDQMLRKQGGASHVMNCPEGGAAYTLRIPKPNDLRGRSKAA
jgi:K+-sensing histidine kinase KdpD